MLKLDKPSKLVVLKIQIAHPGFIGAKMELVPLSASPIWIALAKSLALAIGIYNHRFNRYWYTIWFIDA